MSDNYRILSPVGQGGFDIEHIDGTTIVFDCGSYGRYHIGNCIHHYSETLSNFCDRKPVIDYVFLSHFDNDHINGLPLLKKYFEIRNIVVPYIPKKYRVLYNVVTEFCISRFYEFATGGRPINIIESNPLSFNQQLLFLKEEGYGRVQSVNQKWEWIYRSFFSTDQWEELIGALKDKSYPLFDNFNININDDIINNQIDDLTNQYEPFDIDSFHSDKIKLDKDALRIINNTIGDLFGQSNQSFAKNENGLVMLSKKAFLSQKASIEVYYPECPFSRIIDNNYPNSYGCRQNHDYSACIYTGDMKLDVEHSSTIVDFIRMANEPLLLFQIPHHGSSHNSSRQHLGLVPTDYFFWHDRDYTRIRKNTSIMNCHGITNKLRIIDTSAGMFCRIVF